jgi:hypothetical protein
MNYGIGDIVRVKIGGTWYAAEILDISKSGIYAYVFDLQARKSISHDDVSDQARADRRAAIRAQVLADQQSGAKRGARAPARRFSQGK